MAPGSIGCDQLAAGAWVRPTWANFPQVDLKYNGCEFTKKKPRFMLMYLVTRTFCKVNSRVVKLVMIPSDTSRFEPRCEINFVLCGALYR